MYLVCSHLLTISIILLTFDEIETKNIDKKDIISSKETTAERLSTSAESELKTKQLNVSQILDQNRDNNYDLKNGSIKKRRKCKKKCHNKGRQNSQQSQSLNVVIPGSVVGVTTASTDGVAPIASAVSNITADITNTITSVVSSLTGALGGLGL